MKKSLILFVIILVYLLIYSCKKTEPEHFYVSNAFKQWTVFDIGSYWIFKNDSTLKLDSVHVKKKPEFLNVPAYSSKDNYTLEWIKMSYSSVFFSSSKIILQEGGRETFYIHINDNSMYTLIANSQDNFISFYENKKEGSTYQLLSQDSVFYLGLKKFLNVVRTQHTFDGKKWTFWFAKDIGLIKVTGENTYPDFSWSLVRYQIVN